MIEIKQSSYSIQFYVLKLFLKLLLLLLLLLDTLQCVSNNN